MTHRSAVLNLSDNETMLPRWVAMDLRMALGMSYEQASAAALDGSGVTPE